MRKTLKAIGVGTLAVFIALILLQVLATAWAANERSECLQWAMEAKQAPDFYLLDWQQDQCQHYQIFINTGAIK